MLPHHGLQYGGGCDPDVAMRLDLLLDVNWTKKREFLLAQPMCAQAARATSNFCGVVLRGVARALEDNVLTVKKTVKTPKVPDT